MEQHRDARELLERGLGELAIAADPAQIAALFELARRVESWGARINLTGHRELLRVVHRLVLDAAALATVVPLVETLVDLGSGAGFPGLPIAILRPECAVTLVEAREKRHHFQRAVCRELAIGNATPLRGRAERLAPRPHSAAIVQAVSAPRDAVLLALPWVRRGGLVMIPGGETPPALSDADELVLDRIARYRVPCDGPERSVWIGRVPR